MLFFNRMQRWRVKRKKRRIDPAALLRMRVMLLQVLVIIAFIPLTGQLWKLQVVEGSQYHELAEANRLRVYSVPAKRGVVYDRNHKLLISNEPSFTAAAVVADLSDLEQQQVTEKLARLLNLSPAEIDTMLEARRASGHVYIPVPLKTRLDRETAFVLEERHRDIPGVSVLVEPRRTYLDEGLLPHILGYVGRISPEEYDDLKFNGYGLNDNIGKMGVEYTYEHYIRGIPGREQVEVDVTGRKRRVLYAEEPTPGDNLVLSIDIDLQREMTKLLRENMGESQFAAAVAMDPRNGEILGMVSLPTFDTNLFSGGIKQEDLDALLNDERRPLFNYAVGGVHPPGSTFKLVTGSAALQEGIATPETVIVSRHSISIPNQYDPSILYHFYDWGSFGPLDFRQAVSMSSDIYFYYLAGGYEDFRGLGATRLAEYARMFGLGAITGIDLPGEAAGNVPDPAWKRDTHGDHWLTGDTYNFGIGQGFMLATPIQMARVVSAVANGGDVLQPHVVKEIVDSDGNTVEVFGTVVQRHLDVSDEHLRVIREGMLLGVNSGSVRAAAVPGIEVAGKTGTAEFGIPDEDRVHVTHGWFIGFAPFDEPEIAVAIFYHHGQGLTASPIGAKILDYYFKQKQPQP